MVYAYVQNGIVIDIERRTEQYPNDPYPIEKFYHAALLPFFIPVPDEIKDSVRKGWTYKTNTGFAEPQPFEINDETGNMYLPSIIDVDTFTAVLHDNYRMQSQIQELYSLIDDLVLKDMVSEGYIHEDK